MLRTLLMIVGPFVMLMGLLWVGQGLGIVRWPKESFMIDVRPWAERGAAMVVLGGALVLAARRIR